MIRTVDCIINGAPRRIDVDERASLLDMLRAEGLTGTKQACGVGECGACTVLLDGVAVDSCLVLAVRAEGMHIRTVEGESASGLSPVQRALVDAGAVQCGFCTPGIVMSATALLEEQRRERPGETLSRDEIRRGMAGNLCRCTGYDAVVTAVERCMNAKAHPKEPEQIP